MVNALPAAPPDFADDWPGWAQALIDRPLQIAIIVLVAILAIVLCHRVVAKLVAKISRTTTDDDGPSSQARLATRAHTAKSVLNSVTTVAISVIAIVLVLERLGVNVAVLVASLGVAGVGLGLGAQSLIKDWIAGLFMILEDQYGIGDTIDIGPATGEVVHVSLRMTTVQDDEGVLWHVPNGTIARVGNHSKRRHT
ncbi:MAG: mechanosensitive ion channel family protein [Micrococcales bacterium]|nr:mechanosensitive ion channel family protein [Micrococcales bacterium]